jgi:broad specificity phosphatase PhoE
VSTRLILIAHAGTRLMREGGFPAPDVGLDEGGVAKVRAHRAPAADRVLVGEDATMRETVAALGLTADVERALSEAGHGAWAGRAFADVASTDAETFAAWMASPATGAPNGEALDAVRERVGAWMDRQAETAGTVLAVTSASVIRAAIAHVLDAPIAATLRIDIAPLCAAEFSFNRVWRLQRLA